MAGRFPTTCAEVDCDMADKHDGEPAFEAGLGDLLWNPKAGEGHVIRSIVPCGNRNPHHPKHFPVDCGCGGWCGPCSHPSYVCECGEDNSWRDHHYYVLAKVMDN